MPNRSSKDPNQIAAGILARITGKEDDKPAKNPAAVALGRMGGLKGGKVRDARLTKEQKIEIAKKGAAARWKPKR